MRMLAYRKEPYKCNKNDAIYKIVLFSTMRETFVFLYTSPDAVQGSYDHWYPDEQSAMEDWQELIDYRGWRDIGDPMPYCQHDAVLPIRVKGRDKGTPEWGKLEIYENGEWTDYKP